jgi:hypothetical protein
LVVTNGSDWGLLGQNYENSLKIADDDFTFTFSNDSNVDASDLSDEDTLAPLADLEWTGDDKYPSDYIKQWNEWANKAPNMPTSTHAPTPTPTPTPSPTPTPAPPSGPKNDLHCNGLGSKKYMSVTTLADNIKAFCKDAVAQGGQDKNSGSLFRNYNHGVSKFPHSFATRTSTNK